MFITMGNKQGRRGKNGERNRFIPRILKRTSVSLKGGIENAEEKYTKKS